MTTMKKIEQALILKIPIDRSFFRLASLFVGQGAMGLGLGEEEADEIGLAAEEVMAYLQRVATLGGEVEIRCFAGSHYIQTDFVFAAENLGLRVLNMTAVLNFDDDAILDEMELLIASRMVDRFLISRRVNGKPQLTLVKEFSYPQITVEGEVEIHPCVDFKVVVPDAGQIKWFLQLVRRVSPASEFPTDFLYPGKVVDMAAAGDYHLLIAVSPGGEIGGGVVWRWEGAKTVELFGPYIFHGKSNADMAGKLMDACLGKVARTSALVLINRLPTAALPVGYLEPLGAISRIDADGACRSETAYFREMHEDMGAVSWAHPTLSAFLEKEYRRLYFPREIRQISEAGEAGEPFSVLSAEIDRHLGRVTLRPLWPGGDRLENLKNHLEMFRREGLTSIFFEMDLGVSWQAEFAPDVLQQGFSPQMLLPHSGSGDLLLFVLCLPAL